jgi:hypothetical protein
MKSLITWLLLAACLLLAGCGTEGAPQPPSLDLPQPVADLRASRKADKVTLDWTQPSQTTDRESAAKHVGATVVCQSISNTPAQILLSCPQQVDRVPAQPQVSTANKSQKPASTPVEVAFTLPEELIKEHPLDFAAYAVMVNNHSGRNAGISNSAAVPLAPTLPPPSNLKIEVKGDGVYITANAASGQLPDAGGRLQFLYRLDRIAAEPAAPGAPPLAPVKVAEIPASGNLAAVDRGFEWEKNYVYGITPLTRILAAPGGAMLGEVEGEASTPVQVRTHDIFPPAPPVGLQAVYSGNPQQNFIDLTWAPSTEGDLAGYNVYRREEGRRSSRINADLVKTPVFRDSDVQPGKQYFYSITAVDLRGNESGKSEESHESVPAPQP